MEPFIGQLLLVPYNFAPNGWALCDGSIMSIAQNTALFALIGTTFGGNGTTTFALPDLRGRAPIGMGQGPGLTSFVLGETGGTESVTLNANNLPPHTHSVNAVANPGTSSHPSGNYLASDTAGSVYSNVAPNTALAPNAVGLTGGGVPFDNQMPYLAMNWIIATQGIFPSRP